MTLALKDILNTQFGAIVGAAVRAHLYHNPEQQGTFKYNELDFKIVCNGNEVNIDTFKNIIEAEDSIRPYVNDLKRILDTARVLSNTIGAVTPRATALKIQEAIIEKFKAVDLSSILQPPELIDALGDQEIAELADRLKGSVEELEKMVV